jgi:hypothetical protein
MFSINSDKLYKLLVFFCIAMLVTPNLALSWGKFNSEKPLSAYSFIDSMGIAVHLTYVDTPYGKYHEIIKPRLQELGVHHIRDGFRLEDLRLEDLRTRQKFNDLAKLGIKSTLIMDPRHGDTPSRAVSFAKSVPKSIEAVEGPNEWDLQPELNYKGKSFPDGTRQFQTELYSAIKEDPATAHLPVLSPSIGNPLNISKQGRVACDINNVHHYPYNGEEPTKKFEEIWIRPAMMMCNNQSIIITESGYNANVDTEHGVSEQTTNVDTEHGVSEQTAAKYLLRSFLEYFNWGIKRFYSYELIDTNPAKGRHGLLHSDGSPKPSFIALKNLTSLLQDSQARTSNSFPLKSLDYNLQGNKNNIHHTLMQKNNGTFYLILWQEVPSFEHKTKTDIIVSERPLNLILNTPISQVTTYQPVSSDSPINQYKNPKQLDLKVPDHPLIVELIPKGSVD